MSINERIAKEINIEDHHMDGLSNLLKLVVEEGSAVGFLPPMPLEAAAEYWKSLPAEGVILFTVEINGVIAGSVQLHLSLKQNGQHRAEIAKLMTHPDFRKRGIARLLMEKAEQRARDEQRSLLVLDTREGAPSNHLYVSMGYTAAGMIPAFAKSADGSLHSTVIYYKQLVEA
ncbi:GCN5 family acetyltransferase [Bacillus sp. SJS]|nr:GCN5 family acetyltransferase [Bacillus sp. SJS]